MMAQPMMAPAPMYAPPPPAPAAGPTVINLSNNNNDGSGSPCPACGKETGQIPRKKVGCVTILWCLCLFLFTGGLACCYPFCTDSCKDTELVCVKCHTVKAKIPANCC
eukprot:TRINITY_DN1107_c0_g1_i2.p1 TRINITY_DN1107_c0_g1~~TRINITY_DN1107_c0_g1_i2.p1  ORF type:complete len:118 (-),score=1.33 TRINITY_DN1107_c0_g1_i2:28-351(-)